MPKLKVKIGYEGPPLPPGYDSCRVRWQRFSDRKSWEDVLVADHPISPRLVEFEPPSPGVYRATGAFKKGEAVGPERASNSIAVFGPEDRSFNIREA